MTLNDKIKDSIQKITGLRCFEGEPGDAVNGRFAFFMQLQSRARYNEVAVFFVERPMASPINGRIAIDSCNQLAIKWLNGLYAYSGLKFQEVISQNPVRDNQGGFGVGYRVVLVDAGQNQGVKLDLVTLTLSCDPLSTATLSGAKRYLKNATAKAQATPVYGWQFSKWTNGVEDVSTDNPYEFTIEADTNLIANLTRQKFTVALQGDTGVTGTTGAGSYDYEANCTATATIDSHYDFVGWKIAQTMVSTSNPYTFQVLGATTLNAVTSPKSYNVLGVSNDPTMGSVSGGGTYTYGDTVTLTATPVGIYEFQNWTVDGGVVSTANPYTLTASSNVIVQGNFAAPLRTVTTVVSPQGGGTVTGGGSYSYGATCTLTATAASGYLFKSWTVGGSVVSTLSTYTFPVTADVTVTANFIEDSYFYVENTTDQTQSINFNYENMDMDSWSTTVYYSTDKTNWTAANINYQMDWGEEEPVVTFTFDPIPVAANSRVYLKCSGGLWHAEIWYDEYEQKWSSMRNGGFNFSITFPCKIGGNLISMYKNTIHGVIEPVSYDPSTYTYIGDHHPFTHLFYGCTGITDASDLILPEGSTWGTYDSMFNQCTALVHPPLRIPGGSFMREHLKGMFYRCTSMVEVPQLGNYTLDNSIVTWSDAQERFYYMFQFCTSLTDSTGITIQDSPNYTDYDLTDLFCYSPITSFTCMFDSWPADSVTSFWFGYDATVHPNDTMLNFYCKSSLQNIVSSNSNNWSKIPPSATRTVLPSYTVTTVVSPNGGGTVSGAGTYYKGEGCTLTATEATGYRFMGWYIDNTLVGTDSTYILNVQGDTTVTALFHELVTITVLSVGNGSVTGSGIYLKDTAVTVTATADPAYTFTGWTIDSQVVSTSSSYSFLADSDKTVTANFEEDRHILYVTSEGNGLTFTISDNISVGEWSKDGGDTWQTGTCTLNTGETAMCRYSSGTGSFNTPQAMKPTITSSGVQYRLSGFLDALRFPESYTGSRTMQPITWNGDTNLYSVSGLYLQFSDSTSGAYKEVFKSCSNLVYGDCYILNTPSVGPIYQGMFMYCTNLIVAPTRLPAGNLTGGAGVWSTMFFGCTSLEDMSGTTLDFGTYNFSKASSSGTPDFSQSFYNCTSLTKSPYIGSSNSVIGNKPSLTTSTYTNYFSAQTFNNCNALRQINFSTPLNWLTVSQYNSSTRKWYDFQVYQWGAPSISNGYGYFYFSQRSTADVTRSNVGLGTNWIPSKVLP